MKAQQISDLRKQLDKDIAKYWNILYNENVMPKGLTRNYDLKNVLNEILLLTEKRVMLKLDSICLNMGFKTRSELPSVCNFPTIYQLSECAEILVKLGKIPTLNSSTKVKLGKNKMAETEVITSAYIAKLRNTLNLKRNSLIKQRDDFNDKMELDTTGGYLYLTSPNVNATIAKKSA